MSRLLLLLILFAILFPICLLLLWSFSHHWFYPDLLPSKWGSRAWSYLWGTSGLQIRNAVFESIFLSLTVAFTSIIVAIPTGRALGLYQFNGKGLIAFFLMLPVVVPPLSVSMGLHLWFLKIGLADTLIGVVLIHLTFSLPYSVFVLWGVFSNYNSEIEEQARTLGCSGWKVFYYTTFPMIKSGVMIAGLFSFLVSWSQYLSTLIIGGGEIITVPVLLFALIGSGDRPVAAAVSIVFLIPALVALVFSSKSMKEQNVPGVW